MNLHNQLETNKIDGSLEPVLSEYRMSAITISCKSLAGDVIDISATSVRNLREKLAHHFEKCRCSPPGADHLCAVCGLYPANIGLLRPAEIGWRRLANSDRLSDEVSYIIRELPATGLRNTYSPDPTIWHRFYTCQNVRRDLFFWFDSKFRKIWHHPYAKKLEIECDDLEQLLRAANDSADFPYKLSEEEIADTLHLWDCR